MHSPIAFADDDLNALVERSLGGSFTLKAAWDRLDQARAAARREGAALWPSLDATGGVTHTVRKETVAASGGMVGGGGGAKRTYQTEYSLGLSASYEVDLWGRVRSARDAAALEAQATEHDLLAVALSMSGQVVSAWYSLIEQQLQLRLLEQQIDTNEKYLELVDARFRRGEVSATDVLQQRKLLESNRTETAQVQAQIETLKHQLAVLTGQVPVRADLPEQGTLPELPPLPTTGVPMRWMHARPDIRAAFLRVCSNDKGLSIINCNIWPHLRGRIS